MGKMSYILRDSGPHRPRLVSILQGMSEEEPDVFLLSLEGEKIFTKRLLLAMFSPSLASLFSTIPASDTTGLTVPVQTEALINTIKVLVDGKVTCEEEEDVNDVVEVGRLLGFSFDELQSFPLKKKIIIPDLCTMSQNYEENISDNENFKEYENELGNTNIGLTQKQQFDSRRTCEICEKVIKNYLSFKLHMLNEHNTDVRTEPMSCYTAFLHEERKEHLKTGDGGRLNMEQTRTKWNHMSEEDKDKYRKKALDDKIQLGAKYRTHRSNKTNYQRTCEICERVLTSHQGYKLHMREEHNTDVRTEPMSCYTAFLHDEKKEHLKTGGAGRMNMEKLRMKWKEMSEDDKHKYRKQALEDKLRLGANYRRGRAKNCKPRNGFSLSL